MGKLGWLLLSLYLAAAAAYGGWRGPDLWSDWGIWCFLIPPLALAALKGAADWRQNPYPSSIKIGLVMTLAAVVAIGGPTLLLAWVVAAATSDSSSQPVVRAVLGVGLLAAAFALGWVGKAFAKPAKAQGIDSTINSDGPALSGTPPDPAGR
jgi:hypothetical protein